MISDQLMAMSMDNKLCDSQGSHSKELFVTI